jgi:hypothetical protein
MAVFKSVGALPANNCSRNSATRPFWGFGATPTRTVNRVGPKELCDLLVAYGNHIILFSDSSCAFDD